MVKKISSKDNKEFKFFKKVAENKIKNFCFLESEHLISAFTEKFYENSYKFKLKYLLFDEYFLNKQNSQNSQNLQIFHENYKKNFENLVEISHNLLKILSNLSNPNNFIAVVEILENDKKTINFHCDTLILDEIQDPGNLGTILRTAAATGFQQILLSKNCVKVYTPKVLRSTQGAIFELNIFENLSDDDLIHFLQNFTGLSLTTALLDNFTQQNNLFLSNFVKKGDNLNSPLAWIFGSEGNGVRQFLQNMTNYKIFIPMVKRNSSVESLNVASAVAVCLFESIRRRKFL